MLLISSLWLSCVSDPGGEGAQQPDPAAQQPAVVPDPAPIPVPTYVETGDLDAITGRGQLRILVASHEQLDHLPRQGFPLDHELQVARDFAEHQGLEPVIVQLDRHSEVLPALLEGRGDLAVDRLEATEALKDKVSFSIPLAHTREQLVGRATDTVDRPEDLAGRTIVVRRSSPFWATVEALVAEHPQIELQPAPESLDDEQIIHEVAAGRYDLTVAEEDLLRAVGHYQDDVAALLDLTEPRPVAWAMRPDADQLHAAVDKFLNEAELSRAHPKIYREDLPALKQRRVLRILTRNSAATYFLHRGELMGFELELWRRFAEEQGLRLQVVVPPGRDDLIPWLKEGRGDVVAAGLIVPDRVDPELTWSSPYHEATELVVGRPDALPESVQQLAGRTIAVRRSSAHWGTLEALQAQGIALKIEAAPEDLETEEILGRVASGEYDLTVADSHIVAIEHAHHLPVATAFALGEPRPHGWAMRAGDAQLSAAVDAFARGLHGTAFYNIVRKRYFEDERRIQENTEQRSDLGGQLSPYDPLVQRYADQYGFDWRLIVSQMYQESHFDPEARSWVGAEGLLQLMPATAEEVGFSDVTEPEAGIHAGVKYLDRVRDRFEPELSIEDRTWFTLASYNAGAGHVIDARRLAERQGLDPDRWFGHTETAMLMLAKHEHARNARHGYVRGTEPVNYVRRIRNRYRAYTAATELLPE